MKYKLTDETKELCGKVLHRIVCVTAFESVSVGEVGGWVESENNLSQEGDAWVFGNAKVYGNAEVYGNAKVLKSSDYAVHKNTWSSMRYFTWTRSNNKWSVGCFYGTGEELIKKAYKDSELSGDCYKAVVEMRNKLTELESA